MAQKLSKTLFATEINFDHIRQKGIFEAFRFRKYARAMWFSTGLWMNDEYIYSSCSIALRFDRAHRKTKPKISGKAQYGHIWLHSLTGSCQIGFLPASSLEWKADIMIVTDNYACTIPGLYIDKISVCISTQNPEKNRRQNAKWLIL